MKTKGIILQAMAVLVSTSIRAAQPPALYEVRQATADKLEGAAAALRPKQEEVKTTEHVRRAGRELREAGADKLQEAARAVRPKKAPSKKQRPIEHKHKHVAVAVHTRPVFAETPPVKPADPAPVVVHEHQSLRLATLKPQPAAAEVAFYDSHDWSYGKGMALGAAAGGLVGAGILLALVAREKEGWNAFGGALPYYLAGGVGAGAIVGGSVVGLHNAFSTGRITTLRPGEGVDGVSFWNEDARWSVGKGAFVGSLLGSVSGVALAAAFVEGSRRDEALLGFGCLGLVSGMFIGAVAVGARNLAA